MNLVFSDSRLSMVQIMFEEFNFPSIYIENQSLLSFRCSQVSTGLLVDIEENNTSIIPIIDGQPQKNLIRKEQFTVQSIALWSDEFQQKSKYLSPSAGIDVILIDNILRYDQSIHKDLFANIVLFSRVKISNGIVNLIAKQIASQIPQGYHVNVSSKEDDPSLMPWIGAAVLASNPSFNQMMVTKEEYLESGSSCILQKFL